MKYTKFILVVSLALGPFSVHAEKKQDLTKKILTNAKPAPKTTVGRVAKTGAYGFLTGVSAGAAAALVYVICFTGYNYGYDYCADIRTYYGMRSRARQTMASGNFPNGRAHAEGYLAFTNNKWNEHIYKKGPKLAGVMAALGLSTYGLGRLTLYFARKTKQAAQEVKGTQNSKS